MIKTEIDNKIAKILDSPKAHLVDRYGEDYGVAKLVRDERLVRGITYLPNFVVSGKDVYWIVSNKINNVTSKNFDTNSGHEAWIDKSYIPKEFNKFKNFWSQNIDYHPEDTIFNTVEILLEMKARS